MNPTTIFLIALSLCLGGSVSGLSAQTPKPHVVFLGDSNTWNGGDDVSKPRAWSYWLAKNLLPASARSYARSGATWTNNADTPVDTAYYTELLDDRNVLYQQAARLIGAHKAAQQAAPGLIFVCAGTNDAWFRAKRPGLYSETVEQAYARPMTTATKPSEATSLAASARLTLMLLREAFPQAKIIVVTSPYCVQAPKAEIDRVAETLQQCAALSGVYCTRTERTSGIDPVKEQTKKELTVDGVHTSENGAWQLANCVYNFMAFNNLLN